MEPYFLVLREIRTAAPFIGLGRVVQRRDVEDQASCVSLSHGVSRVFNHN